jgi:hypothetical protein
MPEGDCPRFTDGTKWSCRIGTVPKVMILFIGWKVSGDSARCRISAPGEDVNELSEILGMGKRLKYNPFIFKEDYDRALIFKGL